MNKLYASASLILTKSPEISNIRLNSLLFLCDSLSFKINNKGITNKPWFYENGLKNDIKEFLSDTHYFDITKHKNTYGSIISYSTISTIYDLNDTISMLTSEEISIIETILKFTEKLLFNDLNDLVLAASAFNKETIYNELDLSFINS